MNEETSPLIWQVRLWTKEPKKLFIILAACCLAGLVGWLLFSQIAYVLIGFACVAAATAEFWLPQQYKLDPKGASARCGLATTAITWEEVKRVIPDQKGVKLTPLAADGKLSPFRGVYLRFGEKRDEVMQTIEERWGPVA
ncbi:MAG TPA: hypothetical protein VGL56_11130 [Fimbriimonadaceae bacterium]|jgi:hypothetical protein